jgi:hypothetical protein
MNADAIEFPALVFAQGTVFVFQSLEEFTTATRTGIRNGFYDALTIIDRRGQRFEVKGAEIQKRLGVLSGRYRVAPKVISSSVGPPLGELKSMVLAAMNHPRWTAVYRVEELEDALRSSASVAELVSTLGHD